jgi:hypothetical protein
MTKSSYMTQADSKRKGDVPGRGSDKPVETDVGWIWPFVLTLTILAISSLLLKKFWPALKHALSDAKAGHDEGPMEPPVAPPRDPKVTATDASRPSKPSGKITLSDVDDPRPPRSSAPKPSTLASPPPPNSTIQPSPIVTDSPLPPPTPAPQGDFEKALAQAGQRMDALLKQTEELNRTVKLAEKAKTDAQVELNRATGELTRQLGLKDDQINKLEAMLDRKSTFPSLRALIDVKKLCLDMLNTQKEVSRDEMVSFMTAEIDSQLANLEVQVVDFPAGTPLEKIPGEQVETDRRHELCDDPSKNNQVARMLRPCYYLERDSKRIVVAKALVILYRYNAPSPASEAPSTPAN